MARPPDADSQETYDHIVETARQLILREGVDALSLRRVAEESGRSLGAISYYFDGRQGLLEACLDANYEWMRTVVQEGLGRIAGGTPWTEVLADFVRRLFRTVREHRPLLRLRLLTTMERGELPKSRMERELMPALQAVSKVLGPKGNDARLFLAAHTLELIVTRYGVHTDEECRRFTGCDDTDAAVAMIEEYLVDLATAEFQRAVSG